MIVTIKFKNDKDRPKLLNCISLCAGAMVTDNAAAAGSRIIVNCTVPAFERLQILIANNFSNQNREKEIEFFISHPKIGDRQ